MEPIISDLYVGSDEDYERLKDRAGWSVLRCCKEGPGGHRDLLGYTTQAAPKGDKYLWSSNGDNHLALNFIDPHDPNLIPDAMLRKGIEFIHERRIAGDHVLVACNQGESRGPTTAFLYLRSIGELPSNFNSAERVFRTLCPRYRPGIGMRQFARTNWDKFEDFIGKEKS